MPGGCVSSNGSHSSAEMRGRHQILYGLAVEARAVARPPRAIVGRPMKWAIGGQHARLGHRTVPAIVGNHPLHEPEGGMSPLARVRQ